MDVKMINQRRTSVGIENSQNHPKILHKSSEPSMSIQATSTSLPTVKTQKKIPPKKFTTNVSKPAVSTTIFNSYQQTTKSDIFLIRYSHRLKKHTLCLRPHQPTSTATVIQASEKNLKLRSQHQGAQMTTFSQCSHTSRCCNNQTRFKLNSHSHNIGHQVRVRIKEYKTSTAVVHKPLREPKADQLQLSQRD